MRGARRRRSGHRAGFSLRVRDAFFRDPIPASKGLLALFGVSNPTPLHRGTAMAVAEFMAAVTLFIKGMSSVEHADLAKPKEEKT